MPGEPWVKLKIGIRRSGKMAALPSDAARLGWIYVLVEAKVQRRMGVFDNEAHFVEVLGRFGRFLDAYREAGLLHIAPALCDACASRNPDVKGGEIVVHDYLREQRDPTVSERVAAHRERQQEPLGLDGSNAEANADVTAEKRSSNGQPNATVTGDSRARATTATTTATETTKKVPIKPKTRGHNGAEPTLSKTELEAWSSFGTEWGAFRLAWIGRGLRLPPSGSATDDDTSQRGLLYQILDAQPTNLVRWVREAPGKTARDVVAHVLEQWRGIRAEAGLDDDMADPDAISRSEAPIALAGILGRLVDG